ncbi:MAG: Holliday junction resolvase RuvX [Flavobacteriales bacterium]|nr:Holliday junction resolvase RuvX [Flavobacteriales bacterium]MBL0044067.1 Holliday junction resolvase RuvX [Flavobacteriales bacterium]
MRVLAIDFGLKRTGLAVTDPLRIIASALETVETKALIDYLKKYVVKEQVDGFVVGLPVNLNGAATDATPHVQAFIKELKRHLPNHWVETVDERFSSTMAKQTLLDSGAGKMNRRDKGTLDRISATILLQGWLQQQDQRR